MFYNTILLFNFTISTRVYRGCALGIVVRKEPFKLIYGGNKILLVVSETFCKISRSLMMNLKEILGCIVVNVTTGRATPRFLVFL